MELIAQRNSSGIKEIFAPAPIKISQEGPSVNNFVSGGTSQALIVGANTMNLHKVGRIRLTSSVNGAYYTWALTIKGVVHTITVNIDVSVETALEYRFPDVPSASTLTIVGAGSSGYHWEEQGLYEDKVKAHGLPTIVPTHSGDTCYDRYDEATYSGLTELEDGIGSSAMSATEHSECGMFLQTSIPQTITFCGQDFNLSAGKHLLRVYVKTPALLSFSATYPIYYKMYGDVSS